MATRVCSTCANINRSATRGGYSTQDRIAQARCKVAGHGWIGAAQMQLRAGPGFRSACDGRTPREARPQQRPDDGGRGIWPLASPRLDGSTARSNLRPQPAVSGEDVRVGGEFAQSLRCGSYHHVKTTDHIWDQNFQAAISSAPSVRACIRCTRRNALAYFYKKTKLRRKERKVKRSKGSLINTRRYA